MFEIPGLEGVLSTIVRTSLNRDDEKKTKYASLFFFFERRSRLIHKGESIVRDMSADSCACSSVPSIADASPEGVDREKSMDSIDESAKRRSSAVFSAFVH